MSEEINFFESFLVSKAIIDECLWNVDNHIYDQYIESIKRPYSVESSLYFMRDAAV